METAKSPSATECSTGVCRDGVVRQPDGSGEPGRSAGSVRRKYRGRSRDDGGQELSRHTVDGLRRDRFASSWQPSGLVTPAARCDRREVRPNAHCADRARFCGGDSAAAHGGVGCVHLSKRRSLPAERARRRRSATGCIHRNPDAGSAVGRIRRTLYARRRTRPRPSPRDVPHGGRHAGGDDEDCGVRDRIGDARGLAARHAGVLRRPVVRGCHLDGHVRGHDGDRRRDDDPAGAGPDAAPPCARPSARRRRDRRHRGRGDARRHGGDAHRWPPPSAGSWLPASLGPICSSRAVG